MIAVGPDLSQVALLLVIGGVAGVLGGLLGIGGGLVMIPAMLLVLGNEAYGPNSFHLYKLAALAAAVILSIPAIRQHVRAGAIVGPMLKGIMPMGVLGVVLGVGVSCLFANGHTETLRRCFGAFMLVAVGGNLWQAARRRHALEFVVGGKSPVVRRWVRIGVIVGLPSGLIGGLLGVGGGVWAVPAQVHLLGVRLPNAIANSACMIIAIAVGGAITQSIAITDMRDVAVWQGFWLAIWLAPGAILGGWVGASLTHRLPVPLLRNVFYVLLVVTGVKLLVF